MRDKWIHLTVIQNKKWKKKLKFRDRNAQNEFVKIHIMDSSRRNQSNKKNLRVSYLLINMCLQTNTSLRQWDSMDDDDDDEDYYSSVIGSLFLFSDWFLSLKSKMIQSLFFFFFFFFLQSERIKFFDEWMHSESEWLYQFSYYRRISTFTQRDWWREWLRESKALVLSLIQSVPYLIRISKWIRNKHKQTTTNSSIFSHFLERSRDQNYIENATKMVMMKRYFSMINSPVWLIKMIRMMMMMMVM